MTPLPIAKLGSMAATMMSAQMTGARRNKGNWKHSGSGKYSSSTGDLQQQLGFGLQKNIESKKKNRQKNSNIEVD